MWNQWSMKNYKEVSYNNAKCQSSNAKSSSNVKCQKANQAVFKFDIEH
jgi:hypothetical protein